jgi:SNARE associated Golgi protein
LFLKHGGKVVFFGRFVAVLRAWTAFLAGTNRMRWPRFLLFNAAGAIVWATLYGLGGYFLGDNIHRLVGPVGVVFLVLAVLLLIAGDRLRAPQRTAPGGRGGTGLARPTGRLLRERETSRVGQLPPCLPRDPAAPSQECEATGK